MVFDALHKRKAYIDALGEGLDVFGVLTFIKKFPEEMKPVLVCDGQLTPENVIAILRTETGLTREKDRVFLYYLVEFIKQCSMERKYICILVSILSISPSISQTVIAPTQFQN